ncbi:MAG: ATP-dependent metallopeptidase FtsH/Yme1/Tma family protein [Nitrospirae bacterium]|nr:ATP-dependent metallopeptidase FtsH/Yme1/Tma family protein [Candidatus Manganitrophaceae bacterium]
MAQKKEFPGWILFMILFMITVLPFFFFSPQNHQTSYSDFKRLLREGKVKEVVISRETIQGTKTESTGPEAGKEEPFSTVRVDDPNLISELQAKNIRYTGEIQNHWLKDLVLFWVLPAMVIFFIWSLFARRMSGGGGQGFMAFGRARAKVFAEKEVQVSFNDVAGADEPKEELMEIVEFLRQPKKFQRLGGRIPKGVLLVGPPGTGKTLLARAVAGEARVPFFSMSGSEFVEMFVGVGAARVRDLFAQAQEKAPCIIFIDELDALGRARGLGMLGGGHAEQDQTLNQLLVEMDGFDPRKGVIIMAATNRPEILDPALLRPGRFDRQVLVDRPDVREREEILHLHTKSVKLDPKVDIKLLAARTPGFVGADLANVVNEAALLAARKNKDQVEMEDFEEAINRVTTGLEKKKRVMSKKEKEFVSYHESGHALVAELVPNADPVHRISIIPRGIAALGYTLQLPTEDRYLMTKSELQDRLAVLLGGRVAEEIIFGEISTGAQNDLTRATDIARSMVREFGMSEKLGLVSFERSGGRMPGDGVPPGAKDYSEDLAKAIDEEVKEIIDKTHVRVRSLLQKHRETLKVLAKLLLEKEVVEGETLRKIVHGDSRPRKGEPRHEVDLHFPEEPRRAVGE